MSGRFPWLIANLILAIAGVALPAAPAHADGKFFPLIAEPAAPTIPAQRAIIGWDPPFQTLAIDTAVTGPGAEFAWLIPLPSDPEITTATPGAFETIAALTQPRIERYPDRPFLIVIAALIAMGSLLVIAKGRGALVPVLALALGIALAIVLLLPAVGVARSGAVTLSGVEVRERSRVGVYDTAVLKADQAADLLAWLDASGFAAPPGSAEVMQQYLDRGWVFAAARVAVDAGADPTAELHPHPLAFRFRTDQPVYPMALTAVGNTAIRLDLFVFADGSASADRMRAVRSLAVIHAASTEPYDHRVWKRSGEIRIGHAGLTSVAAGKPHVTHLTAELSPDAQREDLMVEIGPYRAHEPRLYLPGNRWIYGLVVASVAVAAMFLALATAGVRGLVQRARAKKLVLCSTMLAGAVGMLAGADLPEYKGSVRSALPEWYSTNVFLLVGSAAAAEAQVRGVTDGEGLRSIVAEQMVASGGDHQRFRGLRYGDGPWSYEVEADPDADGEWLFVWRDAAGGAHRVRLTGADAGESVYPSD